MDTPAPVCRGIVARVPRALMVALAYAVFGKLGLLLAIPPGYATAVWPASGVALAAALLRGQGMWPGILLGSFLVNISTSWDSSTPAAIGGSLLLATAIGAGAALQAVVGAWLIRRDGQFRNIFTGEAQVIRMLVLGGPLACMVNATIGVGSLWWAGLVPQPNLLFNWWTWWVGDSIGVLIFTPLICAWSQPAAQWHRQQLALTLPMGVLFAAVVALFFNVSATEQRRLSAEFEKRADVLARSLQDSIQANLQMLSALRSFYAASQRVQREEFEIFVSHMLPQYPAVQTVGWAPRVDAAQLAAFEQAMRREGLRDYRVYDITAQGVRVEPAPRDTYWPLAYITPQASNLNALGFDVTSDATRREAVERALTTRDPAATGWIPLRQDPTARPSTLIYLPMFDATGQVLGIASAVLRLDPLLQAALAVPQAEGLHIDVIDGTDPQAQAFSVGVTEPRSAKIASSREVAIRVANRQWTVRFQLPADYLVANRSWQAWGLLAAGLSLAALLGMLLLVLLARQSRVEELVNERTAELRAAQHQLQGYANELERSNRELAQFASVASHDLQAPVRGVLSFVQLLDQRFRGKPLEGKALEFLRHIETSAVHMKSLIDGLLALSRVGQQTQAREPVDCAAVIAEVRQQLAGLVHERNARITHDTLPVVRGSRLELFQVFQNLIANGLKFQPGDAPSVHVSAQREGPMWRLSVRDHGIGIAPQHQARIFRIFQRLHSTEYEGTGIGLAICEKIVSSHGGRIWVESAPGQGATFHFTLPAL